MNGINTTLCYLKRGEEYLMLHRVKKEGDLNKDKWIGIGGKFEAGESPEDCLCREMLEETGLTLHSWRYRGIVTFVSDEYGTEYMHLFDSEDFSGEIKDCDEGDLEWIHRGRLLELTLWEGYRISCGCWRLTAPSSRSNCGMRGTIWSRRCWMGGRSCRRQRHEAAGGTGLPAADPVSHRCTGETFTPNADVKPAGSELTVWFVSDLHLLSEELTDQSPEFLTMIARGDGRTAHYSQEIGQALVWQITSLPEEERPDVLLAAGISPSTGKSSAMKQWRGCLRRSKPPVCRC